MYHAGRKVTLRRDYRFSPTDTPHVGKGEAYRKESENTMGRWCLLSCGVGLCTVFLFSTVLECVAEFAPPAPVRLSLPNPGFEGALRGVWEVQGEVARDTSTAQAGRTSLRLSEGAHAVLALGRLVRVRAGDTYKLALFVRSAEGAEGAYFSLEGFRGKTPVRTLAQSPPLPSATPGWIYTWTTATVPRDGSVTHVGIRLQGGKGTVWFDEVALYRLPPDEPILTGPPPPPPHGQITVRDGHLVDEHGRRVRLWGVNCVDEPNRTYREMTFIARRIRQMGFNAVRMHLYDGRFIDPGATNARGERTSLVFQQPRRGDGSPLDKLDYFIYCCEREGLYIYMTFDRFSPQTAFAPGDYDVLPPESEEDRKAWQQAVQELHRGACDEHVYYVDPRLGEAQARFVQQVLNHRNAYTGCRVADDPYVALYELTNENHFPEWMLQGGFRRWPAYFQSVLQRRWNEWLRERYGDEERLRTAWGRLEERESLSEGTLRVAPVLSEAEGYPAERLADVHRFLYDLFIRYSQRLEGIIRSSGGCAACAPVSWDTLHEHKHKWYYPVSLAELMTVGIYVSGPPTPDRQWRHIHPSFLGIYNLSYASVLGKPTVIYETNTIKPDYWRAYYPLLIATFASLRDWDGVFWYVWADGTIPDQFDADTYWASGLRYAATTHGWHGVVISSDEVLLASLRLGGALFLQRAVPPTPEPVVLTVGAQDLLGRSLWVGDVDVPFPPDAPGPYQRAFAMAFTDFLYTIRYRYDVETPRSSISRPLIGRLPQPTQPVRETTFDWERGVLRVDSPTAKAWVGMWDGEEVSFGDRVRLWVSPSHEPPFFCFGVASLDGKALSESRRALLVLTTYGENRGRELWNPDEAPMGDLGKVFVKAWGYGPPDIARPEARVHLGGRWRWRLYDFRLREIGRGEGEVLPLPPGTPLFYAELWR